MKRIALILLVLCAYIGVAEAQQPRFIFDRDSIGGERTLPQGQDSLRARPRPAPQRNVSDSVRGDSMRNVPPAIPAWKIDSRFGERIPVPMDTLMDNFHQKSIVDGRGVAVGYLGNWGSPAQSKLFFEREESEQFNFLNAFRYYYKKPEGHVFLDTKRPYSNISYQTGGGRQNKEERFTGEMSISFNKKFSLGFDIDYVYARGFYNSLATKQNNYDIFASYKTDKYQMHALVANNNYMNLENGGLDLSEGVNSEFFEGDSKNLSTMFDDTWNKLRGKRLYMTHKYSVGYYEHDTVNFIPVASAFFTTNYTDQRRTFTSKEVAMLDELYHYEPQGTAVPGYTASQSLSASSSLYDYMAYYSFKNTLGISLNEGFRKWVKFGLTAFIEYDIRKYLMPNPAYPELSTLKYSQSSAVISGLLSKRKGEFLRYNLSADLGITGYNLGEFRLNADITTRFKVLGKEAEVKAVGYIKNLKPTFFESNFSSRYYYWADKGFNDIKRVYAGGEIYIPHTQTRLSGGVENLTNYIYYSKEDSLSNPAIYQSGGNIQVISLRLDQKLNAGILHFDNQVVFQTSSDERALPLPKLSLYSNLYLQVKLARVLGIQLGVDAHYHTEYYAPGYDPALMQFYNQKERKVGNFPLCTAYANFHLKKTRFFVMMYNAGKDMVSSNYFNIDRYAYNPMVFKFGLSWNFTD